MAISLGERMKRYESCFQSLIMPRCFGVLRVDGRAFHTYTRPLSKPYDRGFVAAMDETALALAQEVSGIKVVYVQSDEISVVFTDLPEFDTELWFGGEVLKQVSVGASLATATFLRHRIAGGDDRPVCFDARVFSLPNEVEAANYLVWRQQDCIRNSIQSLGRAHFSHARMRGLKNPEVQELLFQEAGINWASSDEGFKNGRIAAKTGAGWEIRPAPVFQRTDFLREALDVQRPEPQG